MAARFLLDFTVLSSDFKAHLNYPGAEILIPLEVIEELDRLKLEPGDSAKNARILCQELEKLRLDGDLESGVEVANSRIRIVSAKSLNLGDGFVGDELIIEMARVLAKQDPGRSLTLVSKSLSARLKGKSHGVNTSDYYATKAINSESLDKILEIEVEDDVYVRLKREEEILLSKSGISRELENNTFFLLKSSGSRKKPLLCRYRLSSKKLRVLNALDDVWGIVPQNKEQRCAFDLLLDPSVKILTIEGKSGTGKTLAALCCGLNMVCGDAFYERLLVSRPVLPLGNDIGYLPGGIEHKLDPWMQPIYDNLSMIMGGADRKKTKKYSHQELIELGYLSVEPITYIRGRSLERLFLIVDEAQNLTPHEVKTILTRAGRDTKIVLTGDSNQIDNPRADLTFNGLTYVAHRFWGREIAGHIHLRKGERSQLADLAANLL